MSESQTNGEWKKPGRKDYLSVIPYLYEVKGKKHAKLIWSRVEVRIVVIFRGVLTGKGQEGV